VKSGRLGLSIFLVVVLVLGALTWFVLGLKPLLGLDLKGGLSVTLQGPANTSKDVMQQTVDRIQQRVDALGVAEPDISLLGSNVVQVQLPGVGSPGTVKQQGNQWCAYTSEDKKIGCYSTQQEAQAKAQAQSQSNIIRIIGTTARLEERPVLQIVAPGDKAKDGTAYADIKLNTDDPLKSDVWVYQDANGNGTFDSGTDAKVQVGPVVITGANLKKAAAVFLSASQLTQGGTPGWRINFSLDKEGAAAFSTETQKLAKVATGDPTKQLAIIVDKGIISSPEVQSAITNGSGEITGGFTESQAKNLAVVLQSGALPVTLKQLNVETVSPTLGEASLKEGVIAGLVGLIALALYLAFYYRLLGFVAWVGMAIWAILAFALVSILGKTVGYALTLAGVAGIIVSLGITADSYIIFYERLKDEVRHGKTVRAAVQPAFKRSWRTIVAADVVTAIAAGVLYVVSIGSVRGFALTLGLCTLLDLFVVWFYKRPTVFWMARNPYLVNMKGIGLEAAVGIEDQEPAPTVRAAIAGGSK
jgi:preprotein translocase subunit SecD